MWKLFVVLLAAGVRSLPLDDEPLVSLGSNATTLPETACRCPATGTEDGQRIHPAPWRSNAGLATTQNVVIHGMPCVCSLGSSTISMRDDYQYTPGVGSHKLHTRALNWNDARKMCNEEGGHLVIVNSATEAQVLRDMFNKSGPMKGAAYDYVAYVGIHDLYKEGEWVTVFGESLARTGYTKWSDKWGGQPDNADGKQHCGAFYREGGLDDVNCDASFGYFCELQNVQMFH